MGKIRTTRVRRLISSFEPLQHVRRLQVLVVSSRQPVERQRLADAPLDPVDQLRVLALPFADPGRQIPLGLLEVPPVVDPAQLLQTVVVRLARQVVQGVAQEVHVAALPGRFRQNLADRPLQTRVVVGHDELDPVQAPLLECDQELLPTGRRLPVGQLHRQHLALPLPVDADRDQHRLRADHPVLTHLLVAGVQDQVGVDLIQRPGGKAGQAPRPSPC